MQSINAGFQSLHDLVKPRHGEKLSKVRRFVSFSLYLCVSVSLRAKIFNIQGEDAPVDLKRICVYAAV